MDPYASALSGAEVPEVDLNRMAPQISTLMPLPHLALKSSEGTLTEWALPIWTPMPLPYLALGLPVDAAAGRHRARRRPD